MSNFFIDGPADEPYSDVRSEISDEATRLKARIQQVWEVNETVINDANFRSIAQNNFWGAVWHLFLLDNLRAGGYNLIPTGDGQPDIRINIDNRTIWIEAVSLTPGAGQNRVDPPEFGVYEPEWDKILLRLTSGLEAKKNAFNTYIQNGVIGNEDACIIALNSVAVQDSGFWRNDMDSEIMTVLFGMGNLLTHIDLTTLQPIREEFAFRPTVRKSIDFTVMSVQVRPRAPFFEPTRLGGKLLKKL